jgi:zinc protease
MKTAALAASALAVLLGATPGRAQTPAAPGARAASLEVPYTRFTLPNGLNVILHEDHSVPVVTINMWYLVGSSRERSGRTGFAHLFEHLMFMGSGHVQPGEFDTLLEGAGGTNNGSTSNDRTNYWINVPTNAMELALFLESDRMGYLLDTMTPATVDAQRDVVKNERRQRVENAPYGMAFVVLNEMLYPEGHPYRWPVIGYMEDLSAASYEDVVGFFKSYYGPANATLAVAGDIDPAATRRLIEKWFGDVKAGERVQPLAVPGVALTGVQRKTITDRVQLPRLYLAWLTPPAFQPADAALDVVASVLADGKNSRLYKRLVYDLQIAQSIEAYQSSQDLSSAFVIDATPRPGHTIDEIQQIVDEEIARLQRDGPTARELERALNQIEASFYARMERVGGFGGKADQLNRYFAATGNPDWFNEDLARYRALSVSDVRAAVERWLPAGRRVELTVAPDTAAAGSAR